MWHQCSPTYAGLVVSPPLLGPIWAGCIDFQVHHEVRLHGLKDFLLLQGAQVAVPGIWYLDSSREPGTESWDPKDKLSQKMRGDPGALSQGATWELLPDVPPDCTMQSASYSFRKPWILARENLSRVQKTTHNTHHAYRTVSKTL